jgi:hypothetical protein
VIRRKTIRTYKTTQSIACLAALLAIAPTAARAASDAVCAKYAERTVAQQFENLKLGCGFTGLRWHGNKIGHFVYCKATDKNTTDAELEVRSVLLLQCGPKTPADAAPAAENQPEQLPDAQDLSDGEEEGAGDDEALPLEPDDLPADDGSDDEGFIEEG